MRINHNISAMNAHRLLGVNNMAGSKTLEKLSSGKRINRAGDDAAGMAISEKMRAQIKGLQMASRNSLDGVSLVQTAEGAMNEVHSMLQRMRELSVQAANGTSAESDRQAIQDEINQLTSEINRVANGTEYNTRTILRGNEGPKANALVHRMATGEPAQTRGFVDVSNMGPTPAAPAKPTFSPFDLKSEQLSIFIDGEEKVVNLTGTDVTSKLSDFMDLLNDALGDSGKAIVDKKGQIEITTTSIGGLSNIKIKGSDGAIALFSDLTPAIKGTDISALLTGSLSALGTIKLNGVNISASATLLLTAATAPHDISEVRDALQADINAVFTGATGILGQAKFTVTVGDSNNIVITENKDSDITASTATATLGLTITSATNTLSNTGVFEGGNITSATFTSSLTALGTITLNGEAVTLTNVNTLKGTLANPLDIDKIVIKLQKDINAVFTGTGGVKGQVTFKVTAGPFNNLIITRNDNTDITADVNSAALGLTDGTTDKTSSVDLSNLNVSGKAENATGTSKGTFYFSAVPDVGATIQIGDETIEFFDSSLAPYVGSNRPIDISGKDNAEDIVDEIVNKFGTGIDGVKISKDPKFAGDDARIIVESDKPGFDGNLIYLEATPEAFTTNLQVGANTGQGFRLEIGDIRAKNLKISADNPTRNPGVKGAAYVKTGATVTDGISSSMVEYAVDVTTEANATAAITVFNNAIVQIAGERSRLGATQNRLEHTISNLDNTAENLTAAMSRIEDTDMALEMSTFQKLNVLQQAGISMLAQANQQSQSVLKLLG